MSWKYGLKKKRLKENELLDVPDFWYEIAEIYGKSCYTDTSLVLSGETPAEIITTLETMIKDLKNNLKIIEEK